VDLRLLNGIPMFCRYLSSSIFIKEEGTEKGPKRDEEIGGSKRMHNVELHNLYSSPSVNIMDKSRRMRLAEHVARMGRTGMRISHW
jgi:hypothetical protein